MANTKTENDAGRHEATTCGRINLQTVGHHVGRLDAQVQAPIQERVRQVSQFGFSDGQTH